MSWRALRAVRRVRFVVARVYVSPTEVMMDRLTISATLSAALLGCSTGGTPAVDTPGSPATVSPVEVTEVPVAAAPEVTAEPVASVVSAEPPVHAAASDAEFPSPAPNDVKAKLPKGRTHVKGVVPRSGSQRTGAPGCCGLGTCAACVPPKQSKRSGAQDCCAPGTCAQC